jgi:hypothetical protein
MRLLGRRDRDLKSTGLAEEVFCEAKSIEALPFG